MSYYNQTAPNYNELYGEEQKKKLEIIKKYIQPKQNEKLLDVGCGTGISSDFNCKVTGVDPSEELLKQRNNKKMKVICASAEKLPFNDSEFDYVISVTAVHNFSNIEKGLREIKHVGKQKFALSILKKSSKFSEIKKLIGEIFDVKHEIEEEKDIIFICN